jgi:hypothetical protein
MVDKKHCVYCERDQYQVPLLEIHTGKELAWICPEHLPVLIHKPQQLEGKLAGSENLQAHDHDH